MFLRGENILCGTSTTGTGTLTLAAVPEPPGGCDPVSAFGTSGAWPCSYTIIEYTDSKFGTQHQMERGYATLTLNASLTSVTLARAPTVTITGMDGSSPTYNNATATALTIGTAANVLVFLAAASEDFIQALPNGWYSTSGITSADGLGITGLTVSGATANLATVSGTAFFVPTLLLSSGLIKSVSVRVTAQVTTPTTNSLSAALFEINSSGLPGKRVINFGTNSGTTGAPLGATGAVTITAGTAVYVPAGHYLLGLLPVWSSGTGTPGLRGAPMVGTSPFGTSNSAGGGICMATVASGNLSDPPTTTSIAAFTAASNGFLASFRST